MKKVLAGIFAVIVASVLVAGCINGGFDASKAVLVAKDKSGAVYVQAKNTTKVKELVAKYQWKIYPIQFTKDKKKINGTLVITNAPLKKVEAGVDDSVVTVLSPKATLDMLKVANIIPPNWTNITGILILTKSKAVVKTNWYFPWYYYLWFKPYSKRPIFTYDEKALKTYFPDDEEEINKITKAVDDEEDNIVHEDEGGVHGEDEGAHPVDDAHPVDVHPVAVGDG